MKRNENGPKVIIENRVLGFRYKGKFYPCELGTHINPDWDALGPKVICDYLEIDTGDGLYFNKAVNGLVGDRTAEQWLTEKRILLCDIGGGQFDHHPAQNFPDQCATSLFYYGVIPIEMRTEKLNNFVRFITNRDTQATAQPFDFSLLCKTLTANNTNRVVYNYMREIFIAYVKMDNSKPDVSLFLKIFEEFSRGKNSIPPLLEKYIANIRRGRFSNIPDLLTATCEETKDIIRLLMEEVYENHEDFKEAQKVLKKLPIIFFGNNSRELAYLKTDNLQVLKAAMSKGFSVVIIESSFGTGIFTQTRDDINTNDIYYALIEAEARARGGNYRLAKLIWYNHFIARQVFNGSRTTPASVRTILSLRDIAEIVATVCDINDGYLPYCKGGSLPCSEKCSFHYMNVSACRDVRRNQEGRDEKPSEIRRSKVRKIQHTTTQ